MIKLEENKHEKDFDTGEFREGLVSVLETENSLSNIGQFDEDDVSVRNAIKSNPLNK